MTAIELWVTGSDAGGGLACVLIPNAILSVFVK